MKKYLVILLVLTINAISVFSQKSGSKVEIMFGPEDSDISRLQGIIGFDETGLYALKYKGYYKYEIHHFDEKLAYTKDKKIILKDGKVETDFKYITNVNNKMYIFSSFLNQKKKKKYLFVQTVNKKTLVPNNDMKKVAEIDFSENSKFNSGYFNFQLSNDSTKLLVYNDLPYNPKEREKFGLTVLNKHMDLLWEKNVTLPYNDDLFDITSFKVDNNGNSYILGKKYEDTKKEKKDNNPNYNFLVLSYTNNGTTFNEYPVNLGDKYITDMEISVNDNKDIICGGFYTTVDRGQNNIFTNPQRNIEGSFFFKVDGESKTIKNQSFQKFDISFITEYMKENKKEKLEEKAEENETIELPHYELKDIIMKDDGGAVLIAEQNYFRSYTVSNLGVSQTNYIYDYNDIIVVNIAPNGEILWSKKIPKSQHSVNDEGYWSSFALSVVGDNLHFIYNDNPENLTYDGTSRLKPVRFNNSSTVVVLLTLDKDGNQTKEALFNNKDIDIIIRPKVSEQISKNEMILFGQRGKKQGFTKVTFK